MKLKSSWSLEFFEALPAFTLSAVSYSALLHLPFFPNLSPRPAPPNANSSPPHLPNIPSLRARSAVASSSQRWSPSPSPPWIICRSQVATVLGFTLSSWRCEGSWWSLWGTGCPRVHQRTAKDLCGMVVWQLWLGCTYAWKARKIRCCTNTKNSKGTSEKLSPWWLYTFERRKAFF